jgi:hypothetical protein
MTEVQEITPASPVDVENAQVTKPRRPHRRTRPLPEPEPAPVGQAEPVVEAEPQLPQPPSYLVSIALSRRDTERRLLERDIERCDREIATRTLRLRLSGATDAEVQRVEQQLRQARDERANQVAVAAALTSRELVLHYAPESGWR